MDIENRNTNRVKFFMRKRLEIAVFLAVLLGIALTVSRYFEFVSKTVYEESVSHLTEVFHQSNNVLSELTNKNLTIFICGVSICRPPQVKAKFVIMWRSAE